MAFNPNELLLERIRSVEEYDPGTMELMGRYTQIENPSLQLSADGTTVTDAMGAEIATFYNAQQGTFSFTNSLHSLDLWASQFGAEKEIADVNKEFIVPVSEVITLSNNKAKLKYIPVGETGAEVKYAKIINENNTYGQTYVADAVKSTDGEFTFTVDADSRELTFPDDTEGRVFVQYERKSANAVRVTKRTDGVPEVRTLIINAIFHDPCNKNIVYAGVLYIPRAQINPENVELNLTPDGKHSAEYRLQKPYCDEDGKLVDIIITED